MFLIILALNNEIYNPFTPNLKMKNLTELISNDLNSKRKIFKKGEIIQKMSDLDIHAIYVVKGILRSYLIDSKGKEHTYMFGSEGWIIGDIEAAEYDNPAQLFIDCLEDSEIILFDRGILFQDSLSKEQLAKHAQMLFRSLSRSQRRVLMLMGTPAEDRYKYFLEIYPDIPNRVPQKMIASYLGIAPQTLSVIRSRIAKMK